MRNCPLNIFFVLHRPASQSNSVSGSHHPEKVKPRGRQAECGRLQRRVVGETEKSQTRPDASVWNVCKGNLFFLFHDIFVSSGVLLDTEARPSELQVFVSFVHGRKRVQFLGGYVRRPWMPWVWRRACSRASNARETYLTTQYFLSGSSKVGTANVLVLPRSGGRMFSGDL